MVGGGRDVFVAFASVRQGSCYLHAPKVHVLSSGRQICSRGRIDQVFYSSSYLRECAAASDVT